MNESDLYCTPGATEFYKIYSRCHGFVALTICVVGSITNLINITVLSQKKMRNSTNSLLTGLAVADLLVMLEYIPYVLHMNITISPDFNMNTYSWTVFIYFHSIFSQTFHTIAVWLAVTLAVWRYIAVAFPHKNSRLCNKSNTRLAIVSAYITCPIMCLPIYFAMAINEKQTTPYLYSDVVDKLNVGQNRTVYVLEMSNDENWVKAIMWIYSVILKLIPSIALLILILCLISKLIIAERKRHHLLQRSKLVLNDCEKLCMRDRLRYSSRTDRTTRMLLAVLGLFLSAEVPQGILGLASAVAPDYYLDCYTLFGDLMDTLALFASSVNFVLYCTMSHQFRNTFTKIICVNILSVFNTT